MKSLLDEKSLKSLTEFRRELHQHPELSGEEVETARRVAEYLSQFDGFRVLTGVGKHGILATIDSGKPGSHTVLRAELDALPIQETSEIPYASINEGVGHHCGHDGHIAILCGMAEVLSKNPIKKGKVTLMFQPAEEIGSGAEMMLNDLVFADFQPDRFIALHGISGEPSGTVLYRKATMLVASTGMHIRVIGRTSHAAEPESGNSPWPFLKRMADEALMMPSLGMKLHKRSKVTLVGLKTGGPHFGTSPGNGDLWLTIRAYTTETLEEMVNSLKQKAIKIAQSEDLKVEISLHEHFEATMNDDELVEVLEAICSKEGFEIQELEHPFSYSEDFGRFTSVAPSLFLGLGAGENLPALHASTFDFPDELISAGINLYDQIMRYYHS